MKKIIGLTSIVLVSLLSIGCAEDGADGADGASAADAYCTPVGDPDDVQRVCFKDFRLGNWALDIYNDNTQDTSRLVICEGIKFRNYYADLLTESGSTGNYIPQDAQGEATLYINYTNPSAHIRLNSTSGNGGSLNNFNYAEIVKEQEVNLLNLGTGIITKIVKNPVETCQ